MKMDKWHICKIKCRGLRHGVGNLKVGGGKETIWKKFWRCRG